MSLKITIVDNKTGKVLVDENDAGCIIGLIGVENGVRSISFMRCNSEILYHVVSATQGLIIKTNKEHPELELLGQLEQMLKKREGEEES